MPPWARSVILDGPALKWVPSPRGYKRFSRAMGFGLPILPAVPLDPILVGVSGYAGSPGTGTQTVNVDLPDDVRIGDLVLYSFGHRSYATHPAGGAQLQSCIGGQSTANSQTTYLGWVRVASGHVLAGHVAFTGNFGGTSYGFVVLMATLRSPDPDLLVEVDTSAAGPTSTNATSKITPTFAVTGSRRRVFHFATYFQNSGVDSGAWSFPTGVLYTPGSSGNREHGAMAEELPYYPQNETDVPARTWTIGGVSNGGMGTVAASVHCAE